MSQRQGKCLCGAVTYRAQGEPVATRVCWCRDCQYLASNGTVNAIFPTAALEITGPVAEHSSVAHSGNTMLRRFCSACGSHLFAQSSARPHLTVIRAGTLDEPSSISPEMTIWTSSAPNWACINPDLTCVEQQPAPAASPKPVS